MFTAFSSYSSCLDATIRIASIGCLISSLEMLSARRIFAARGIMSITAIAPLHSAPVAFQIVHRALYPLLFIQAMAFTTLLLLGPFPIAGRVALCVGIIAILLTQWRRQLGGDGAEQMSSIVLIAAASAVVPTPSDARIFIAVLFIAAQATLSYTTAGVAKLISARWRKENALASILNTDGHGQANLAAWLACHPTASLLASWSVISLEVLFPFLVLGPIWLVCVTLSIALVFHATCAVVMGLNNFIWAFAATYPCILAVSSSAQVFLRSAH
jgi:hypothetical protein